MVENTDNFGELFETAISKMRNVVRSDATDFETLFIQISGLSPESDFRGADLRDVDFGDIDLTGFDLTNADLRGADMRRVKGLEKAVLNGALVAGAMMPIGSVSEGEPSAALNLDQELEMLEELEEFPEREDWASVWFDLRRKRLFPYQSQLDKLGYDWLRNHIGAPGFSLVFSRILDVIEDASEVVELAKRWLKRNFDNWEWPSVFREIVQLIPSNDIIELGYQWLVSPLNEDSLIDVLYELDEIEKDSKKIRSFVLSWMNENTSSVYWPIFWEFMLEETKVGPEITEYGIKWILDNEKNSNAGSAISTLLYSRIENEKIFDIALNWLFANRNHHQWVYVWLALVRQKGTDGRLLEIGSSWLPANLDSVLWPVVWRELKSEFAGNKRLIDAGHSWLLANLDHHAAVDVWEILEGYRENFREIEIAAMSRLANVNFLHSSWVPLWEFMLTRSRFVDRLLPMGSAWLRQNIDTWGWERVLAGLVDHDFEKDHWASVAVAWLNVDGAEWPWVKVWGMMFDRGVSREKLIEIGYARLSSGKLEYSAPDVWIRLYEAEFKKDEIASIGLELMARASIEHGVDNIWHALCDDNFDLAQLRIIAERWVSDFSDEFSDEQVSALRLKLKQI